MKIGITGVTGNMGSAVLQEIVDLQFVDKIYLLIRSEKPKSKKISRICKVFSQKIEFIHGDMLNKKALEILVDCSDVIFDLAAVIPPNSDKNPKAAVECNELGAELLLKIIEKNKPDLLFIHTSTVAVYGNRSPAHPYVEIGDPLLPSVGDIYAISKMRAEYKIFESSLSKWVILRQTAMAHDNLMSGNLSDGLMFHTCFNSPLEWVTAKDSGLLFKNILVSLKNGLLNERNFYKHVFNIGNKANRITGFETINNGFSLMGAGTKEFFKPYYNASRNFHGAWFRDSDKLNDLFNFQSESLDHFWLEFLNKNPYISLGKLCPKSIISKLVIDKLLDDDNSPNKWVKDNKVPLIKAYYKSIENFNSIPHDWDKFYLFCEDESYNKLKKNTNFARIDLGFDTSKDDRDIDIDDLKNVAYMHGGKLLTKDFLKGNVYAKVQWQNADGVIFEASPYTILRGGHWINESYFKNIWEFNRLAKIDKIYNQIWFDTFDKSEDDIYYLDENYILKTK
ncbi:MAG: NAD(P)-dependent oxidoreductase [Candidatus Onthovivens sp.]|nr:NAD(P)-dependent oxidoreductase [Candidatus Onthovivens sp.]